MTAEWFVLRTHFAQEERAARELLKQGYETFLPLARSEYRRKGGLLVAKVRPLFTSYLFVTFDPLVAGWQAIASTYGITAFIGYREGDVRPLSVPAKEMVELRTRIELLGGIVPIGISRPRVIEPGVLVRILCGPYRDQVAPVQAIQDSRVEVLLRFAGAPRPVKLHRDILAVAD